MAEYTRDEVEAEFMKYVERGTTNDWSAWADQFTEDALYVEHAMGIFHGREEIRKWIVETMASVSGMSFPYDWYMIEGNRVVMYCWNIFNPLPGMSGEYKFAGRDDPRVRGQRPVVPRRGHLQREGDRGSARALHRGRDRGRALGPRTAHLSRGRS